MESPNKSGDTAPTQHLMLPSETSSARNWLCLIESLAKEVLWNPQTSQAISKVFSFSPQPDDKILSLKTILSYVIEHREIEMVLTGSFNHTG